MHGDKSQGQRERALASFEAGRVDTLVATDVAARGIDVNGISHVINFDPPEDREGYVHRTGRTGRAGRTGHAVTFVGGEQASDVGKIASELRLQDEFSAAGLGHAGRSHGRREAAGGGGSRGGGAPRGARAGGGGGCGGGGRGGGGPRAGGGGRGAKQARAALVGGGGRARGPGPGLAPGGGFAAKGGPPPPEPPLRPPLDTAECPA